MPLHLSRNGSARTAVGWNRNLVQLAILNKLKLRQPDLALGILCWSAANDWELYSTEQEV
jgi:hypothetical protein